MMASHSVTSSGRRSYLLCPQCGDRRFYRQEDDGSKSYFKVGTQGEFFVGVDEVIHKLAGFEFSGVYCCGCSWKGGVRKLVRFFCG